MNGKEIHFDTPDRFVRWMRETPGEQLGAFGERLWSAIATGAELHYIPLSKIDDRGAPMQRGEKPLILPDMEVNSPRFSVYIDSKAKRHPVYYRNAREWRHGIDRRNWNHYAAISEFNRKHCCLGIFEAFQTEAKLDWSGALLLQSLTKLGSPIQGFSNQDHMVYWPRAKFTAVGTLTPIRAVEITYRHSAASEFKDAVRDVLELTAQKPIQMMLF